MIYHLDIFSRNALHRCTQSDVKMSFRCTELNVKHSNSTTVNVSAGTWSYVSEKKPSWLARYLLCVCGVHKMGLLPSRNTNHLTTRRAFVHFHKSSEHTHTQIQTHTTITYENHEKIQFRRIAQQRKCQSTEMYRKHPNSQGMLEWAIKNSWFRLIWLFELDGHWRKMRSMRPIE